VTVYEVSKMAQGARFRNRQTTAENIVLQFSGKKLALILNNLTTIHYHKYGFVEIPLSGMSVPIKMKSFVATCFICFSFFDRM
jgi:hypothetical protein